MKRRHLLIVSAMLLFFAVITHWRPWLPHDARVDDRQQRFQAFRGHLRQLRDVAEQSDPENVRLFGKLSHALLSLTDEQWQDIPARFPPDTRGGRSAASETIWSDTAGFVRAAERHRAAVANLAALPADTRPQDRQAAVQQVAAACQSCHEHYRD